MLKSKRISKKSDRVRENVKAHAHPGKQFDFFFFRTCFRTMNEYYKLIYQKFSQKFERRHQTLKPSLRTITKLEMDKSISEFIKEYISPEILESNLISRAWKDQIITSMVALLHTHRHTKQDLFIEENRKEAQKAHEKHQFRKMDFSVMRDVMYQYS